MTQDEIGKACAFTGHKPERLTLPQARVIEWLEEQTNKAAAVHHRRTNAYGFIE